MISRVLILLIVAVLSSTANRQKIMLGYYSADNVYEGYRIQDVPVKYLTHLAYSLGIVSSSGIVSFQDEWASVRMDVSSSDRLKESIRSCNNSIGGNLEELWKLKKLFPHLRTLFVIGGWDENSSRIFQSVISSNSSRRELASSASRMVVDYGFDGVQYDYWNPKDFAENQNFAALLEDTRTALDGIDDGKLYELVVSATNNPIMINQLPLNDTFKHVDWINVMAFGYGDDMDVTFHDAPLFRSQAFSSFYNKTIDIEAANNTLERSVSFTISSYQAAGVPSSKLVLGLSLYGSLYTEVLNGTELLRPFSTHTGWSMKTRGQNYNITASEPVPYSYIIEMLDESRNINWQRHLDDDAKSSWIYDPYSKYLLSYLDDEYSLRYRVRYMDNTNLAGVMFWQLHADSRNPKASFVRKTVESILLTSAPKFIKYPICAPKSSICNIRTEDSSCYQQPGLLQVSASLRNMVLPSSILLTILWSLIIL